jgi:hypothetical protein
MNEKAVDGIGLIIKNFKAAGAFFGLSLAFLTAEERWHNEEEEQTFEEELHGEQDTLLHKSTALQKPNSLKNAL